MISRVDALSGLAGAPRQRVRCASGLVIAAFQSHRTLNPPTRMLLRAATDIASHPAIESISSPGGVFRVHYRIDRFSVDRVDPRDADRNGVPDGVERVAAELTDLLADFVHVLDWAPAPAPTIAKGEGSNRVVDVHLVNLGGGPASPVGANGYVVPLSTGSGQGAGSEGADSVILLDARLTSFGAALRASVAHQMAHWVLIRESLSESPWWHEASASWLENRLAGNAAELAREFGETHTRRSSGLDDETLGLSLEAFLWPHYLGRSTGDDPALLRRLWEEMAAVPGNNTFEAMDSVLSRRLGTGLADELAVFNVWNLFLGQADDGRHYTFGAELPTPRGDATYELFPASDGSLAGPLAPSGSALVRLLGDGSRGGLRIEFSGGDGGLWDLSLLVHSATRPGEIFYVPIEVDDLGRGQIAFPWRTVAAADLLVQNLATPRASQADYSFRIDYDPVLPFDLLGFTATESPQGARLSWSTDGEENLAGWNVYRATGPLGPYSRINSYPIPAAGSIDEPMAYVFVDGSVVRSRKYYYHLEGVTFEGFTEISHPAGVRLEAVPSRLRSRR